MHRVQAATGAAILLSAVACVVLVSSTLRQPLSGSPDVLAYDGVYDTPPVTWYYPATSQSQNTLGYTCVSRHSWELFNFVLCLLSSGDESIG